MTKKFKSLSISLMIAFLLTTISCQVEESAITESKNQELLIKKIDSKKVFENKKVAQKINRLKQNTEDLKTGRIIYDSTLDFFIDTDNVVYADNGNFQTYTFPISRTTSTNTLENIVIKIENDSINTFLLNYNKNYNDVTNQQSGLEQVACQAIDFNTNNVITSRVTTNEFCFDVYVWDIMPRREGELTGVLGDVYGWVFQGSNCFSFGGGGTGTTTGNYGDTGGNLGGPSGTGSGGGSNTGIVTVPTEFNPLSTQEVKSFVAQLNPDQLAWWNDEDNEDAVESIAIYLSQADADPAFVEELIDLAIANDATFQFDDTIDSSNTLVFNTIQDFENHLETNLATLEETDFEIDAQNQRIATAKLSYGTFGITIKVKQNMLPTYEVVNVSSVKTGLSILLSYEQTDYNVDIVGSYVNVDVYGLATTGIKITVPFEANITFEDEVHFRVVIDKNTGHLITAYEIND